MSMREDKIRINKYIANAGVASRRKADELIEQGLVKINGKVIKEPGVMVGPKDEIKVRDKVIRPQNFKYVIFNKPAGYITSTSDEKGRKTIYDILPESLHRFMPVGRLDKDSSGLLILTNNGEFIQKLTHPSVKVPKVYRVCVEGKVVHDEQVRMAKGIEIEKGQVGYADSAILEYANKQTVLEITLHQGLNRQIRKMMSILGHEVVSLKRIAHANVELRGLKKGQFKFMKPNQVQQIKNYIKNIEKKHK